MNANRNRSLSRAIHFAAAACLAFALPACAANVEPESQSATEGVSTSAFNLSDFELQLPIGSPDDPKMVESPTSFSDDYFYVDSDGALTFMDPRTGVTTSGSEHPRSELRETKPASWAATGTNTMTGTVAVTKVPSTVTIAQIFQAPSAPSKPLLELQYLASGKVQVFIESTNEGGGGPSHLVGTVEPGAKFEYTLSLSDDEISVTINGKVSDFTLPSSFKGEKFYFKWGDYDQTATSGAISTVAGTIVKYYAHSISHG